MKEKIENIILRLSQHTYFSDSFDGLPPYEAIMQTIIDNLPDKMDEQNDWTDNPPQWEQRAIGWNNFRQEILTKLLK